MTRAFDMSPESAASRSDREAATSQMMEQHVPPTNDRPSGHAHAASDVEKDRPTQVQSRRESHAGWDLHELELLLRTHENWGAQMASEGSMPGM